MSSTSTLNLDKLTPWDTDRGPPAPRPGILDISPYVPGKAGAPGIAAPIKLSANENILGCSPAAKAAFAAVAGDLNLYPDGRGTALRDCLASHYRVEGERLILGCGSDEIFALLAQVFLGAGDNIVQGEFGFGAYAIAAQANEAQVKRAREPNYRIDVDLLLAEVDERTRLVFIANPANPTGTYISAEEVRRLHAGLPPGVVLVLDGAYAEFNRNPDFTDGLDLARDADNIVVTHTFSKLHGLAALRVGWAYAPAAISDAVNRIRPPFNTSIPGHAAAIAALGDEDFQAHSIAHMETWRPWLAQQLGGLGLEVTPSAANFLLVKFSRGPGRTAGEAEAFLAARGLIVRGVGGYGLPHHLRITIGLEEHNRAVIDALAAFMSADDAGR
jgi:histidinol-phosphate aminotransferase